MSGTQARLPGTLPTPRDARARLALAVAREVEASSKVAAFVLHMKSARAALKSAATEAGQAEQDLLAAEPGSPEETAADARHATAWRDLQRAEASIASLLDTSASARADRAEARAALRSAREEMEAIRQGRRRK